MINRGKQPRFDTVNHQVICPKMELYNHDNAEKPYLTFSPFNGNDGLQSFSFSFSTQSLSTTWSASLVDTRENEKPVFDEIKIFSVVKIYCADQERAEFVGIIISKTIETASPIGKRNMTISGTQITSLLSDFVISSDFAAFGGQQDINAIAENYAQEFAIANEGLHIQYFVKKTLGIYEKIQKGFLSNSEYLETLALFCGGGSSGNIFDFAGFDTGASPPADEKLFYPITNLLFSNGRNSVSSIWRSILPVPLYEMYGRVDQNGKPRVVIRKCPFSPAAWKKLNNINIYPDVMIENAFNLTQSNSDVYTVFNSYLQGSPASRDQTIIYSEIDKKSNIIQVNEKVKRYGYRPMEVNFMGYDTVNNVRGNATYDEAMRNLNKLLMDWYGKTDEFYTGTFRLIYRYDCTKKYQDNINPEVGGVVDLLGGQFYVNGISHQWSFGGAHTVTLNVMRGYEYNSRGEKVKEIQNIGKRYNELQVHI